MDLAPIGARLAPFALPAALVAAAMTHAGALRLFFAQDDVTFLARARGMEPTPWSLARPLSEGWTWRLLDALFGLNPAPYHLVCLAIHLANTALVHAVGARLFRSRGAGFAAALLFGVSSVAFTPARWISNIVMLMVTGFSLLAFWLWLIARERGSTSLLWLSAVAALGAFLSKESALLLPLVLVVAHLRLGDPAARPRALVPPLAVSALFAVAFVATLRLVHFVGSETYALSRSPLFIALNLSTYLKWLLTPQVPVRDAVAAMDPTAWPAGVIVLAAVALVLWIQRRAARHPLEVAAAWFAAFLAPVVALKHHTYLYYVYHPLPGLCWVLAGAGQMVLQFARRRSPGLAPALTGVAALGLVLLALVDVRSVRARERAMQGTFPMDKTVRESLLLRNAVHDLRAANLPEHTPIAFVNPAPRQHVAMADTSAAGSAPVVSYVPLEGALRGGEAIRLFFPDLHYVGFSDRVPRAWENAEILFYQDEGTLRPVGRGGRALAELGYFLVRAHEWRRAEEMFLRSRQLGDTLADATFGLIITRDYLGAPEESQRYAREFLARWPNDERAKVVAGSGATSR